MPVATLDLRHQGADGHDALGASVYLTGAEWSEEGLRLNYRGALPTLDLAEVVVAGSPFPIVVRGRTPGSFLVALPPAATAALGRPCPVFLRWLDEAGEGQTNPVFVSDRAALDAMLRSDDRDGLFDKTGDLALTDEEFKRFFRNMLDVLVLDRQSAWQLAGRATPPEATDGGAGTHIASGRRDSVNCRHPRIRQYQTRHGGRGTNCGQACRRSSPPSPTASLGEPRYTSPARCWTMRSGARTRIRRTTMRRKSIGRYANAGDAC